MRLRGQTSQNPISWYFFDFSESEKCEICKYLVFEQRDKHLTDSPDTKRRVAELRISSQVLIATRQMFEYAAGEMSERRKERKKISITPCLRVNK